MCFNKTRSLCSSLTAEGRLVHNCDGPRSDAAQTSGSSVSTEVWTGVCSITGAIHFFQGRASVSDVGLGLFFPCLPGGIHLTSVRLLLFMKRRSSRLENLKNVDEFWLHSFLRDPFFSILFHSNKKKEKVFTAWQLTWCIFAVFDILWSRHQSSELPWKILKSKQHFATSMMNETSDIFPFDYITIQSVLFWAVLVTWHTGWSIILVQV